MVSDPHIIFWRAVVSNFCKKDFSLFPYFSSVGNPEGFAVPHRGVITPYFSHLFDPKRINIDSLVAPHLASVFVHLVLIERVVITRLDSAISLRTC